MKKVQVGEVYARLTVVEEHPERDKWGSRMVWCICSCGNPERVLKKAYLLGNGQCKSCGCLQKENFSLQGKLSAEKRKTHGMNKTKTHRCWVNMKARCDDPNHPAYHDYGGRGITYCYSWAKFEKFLEDMGMQPKGMSINRIDPNGDYCKENCEWADNYKQGIDKRKPKSGVTSKYKGVSFNTAENKYKAAVTINGITYHLGYSKDPLELALRYDEKILEITGSESGTNKSLGLL